MIEPHLEISSNPDVLREIAKVLWDVVPPEQFPHGLRTHEYMWKYKISKSAYQQLLTLVNMLDLSKRGVLKQDIEGYIPCSTNVARVIALIIAEWYEREATSLAGDGAMDIFTFGDQVSPKEIWMAAGFDEELLHKAKKSSLWQTAMCVLGGFPLIYVNAAENRFETLIHKLSEEEIEEDDELTDGSSWEQLFDDNNTVFSGSLKRGSCKEYVDALWAYMETEDIAFLPFCKEDLEEDVYKKFCELLKNGYGEKLQKDFFKETHNIYTTDEEYSIQAQLRVQIGFKKDNHILFASQLEKIFKGADLSGTNKLSFFLRAVNKDSTAQDSQLRFYRRVGIGRYDFVSVGLSPLYVEYDLFNIDRIELYVKDVDNAVERRLRSFTIDKSLELYESRAAYCWTTRKQSSARKALLLDYEFFQDFPKQHPIEKRCDDTKAARPIWSWLHLNESVELRDVSGESHFFKCGNAQPVQVAFSYSGVERSIRLNEGKLDFVSPEENGLIRLLYGFVDSKGKSLNLSVMSLSSGKLKKSDKFLLEYKEKGSFRYKEWTESSAPEQGFISIRVTTKSWERLPYISDVYYIPSIEPIERNLITNEITFNGVQDVSYYDCTKDTFVSLQSTVFHDTIPEKSAADVPDTVVFRVGSDSNYVSIEVYRAFWMQELIKDKKPKRFMSEEKKSIPAILHKHFTIRTINNDGCLTTRFERLSNRINDKFQDGFLSSPLQLCESIPINSAVDVYVYRNITAIGTNLKLHVSPNHLDDYRFFFWRGSKDYTPTALPSSYDSTKKELTLDCSSCKADRGVVFQSLKNCLPYHYYRPFYIRYGAFGPGITPFYSKAGSFINYSREDICFSYLLYREHRVYAAVFSPLLELRNSPKWQIEVLAYALSVSDYTLSKDDVLQLNRLCAEVGFDWMLLPRKDILGIISNSGDKKDSCILSLRNLFARSQMIKENDGSNRYERHYFKRIFLDNDRFFDGKVKTSDIFRTTRYRSKIDARTFVDYINGNKRSYSGKDTAAFLRKISSYNEYISLFHDVFYQYVIAQ